MPREIQPKEMLNEEAYSQVKLSLTRCTRKSVCQMPPVKSHSTSIYALVDVQMQTHRKRRIIWESLILYILNVSFVNINYPKFQIG